MKIREYVSLKEYTTFAIGGPARYMIEVSSVEDALYAVAFARDEDLPYLILGGGSNMLVNDEGYPGVVLRMAITFCEVRGTQVHIGAGTDLLTALWQLADAGLSGLEGMAGVPGCVGGAVRGNAGAFGVEMADVIERVHGVDMATGERFALSVSECGYGYRQSVFKSEPTWLITSVECSLTTDDPAAIRARMEQTIAAREEKHIQDIRSAGSFFMNPVVPEDVQQAFHEDKGVRSRSGRVPAGWLLERTGLECKRIGDIQAGEMHANYFINVGEGTAAQAIQLASLAKTRVRDQYGVQLTEEVQLVGF